MNEFTVDDTVQVGKWCWNHPSKIGIVISISDDTLDVSIDIPDKGILRYYYKLLEKINVQVQ